MRQPSDADQGTGGFEVDDREVIHEVIDGEAVLVHLGTGRYHSLRGAASEIWTLVVAGHGTDSIVAAMEGMFEGEPGLVARETRRLLDELVAQGLVRPAAAKASPPVPSPGSRRPFERPLLETFEDMQDLLLLDPIHETGDEGWPKRA